MRSPPTPLRAPPCIGCIDAFTLAAAAIDVGADAESNFDTLFDEQFNLDLANG